MPLIASGVANLHGLLGSRLGRPRFLRGLGLTVAGFREPSPTGFLKGASKMGPSLDRYRVVALNGPVPPYARRLQGRTTLRPVR